MQIKELYEEIGGDYADVSRRLPTEKMIKKFVLKFPNDKSFASLEVAIANKNWFEVFCAAHTLKGVALNLAFASLAGITSEVTELCRPVNCREQDKADFVPKYDTPVDEALVLGKFADLKKVYENTIATIGQLEA